MTQTLARLVALAGAEQGQNDAIIFRDRALTFRQLDERSSRIAQALAADGFGAGDRIAYLDKNTPQFFELLFGVAKLGAVTVGVNWRLQPAEIGHILRDADAKAIVVGEEYEPTISAVKSELGALQRIISLGKSANYPAYETFIEQQPANATARCAVALTLVALQRYREAQEFVETSFQALPDSAVIAHILARLLAANPEDELRDSTSSCPGRRAPAGGYRRCETAHRP